MSFKTLVKRIFRIAEANVNAVVVSQVSAEKNYKLAAVKIHEEIHRLEKVRVETKLQSSNMLAQANRFKDEALTIDAEIRYAVQNEAPINNTRVLLAVQKHKMAKLLQDNVKVAQDNIKNIAQAIVVLGNRLDEIRDQLDLIEANEKLKKLGVSSVQEIEYRVDLANVDVDTLVRESELFDREHSVMGSVSDMDVQNYLDAMKRGE